MDMDMDGKIHIHGNPAKVTASSRLVGTTKALTTVNNVWTTRRLCYRKDDRAMRAI